MSETQADGSSEMERETKRVIDNLDGETDPGRWAAAFVALFGTRRQNIDEGLMISWFANAMEAGRRAEREKVEGERVLHAYNDEALQAMDRVGREAGSTLVGPEHLLIAAVAEGTVPNRVMRRLGITEERLRAETARVLAGDGIPAASVSVSEVVGREGPPTAYLTARSGELHHRMLLESGRLEGMGRMLEILGEVDKDKLAAELQAMGERLRGDTRPRQVHKPPEELRKVLGLDEAETRP